MTIADSKLRVGAAICGIAGPIALTVYFAAPTFSSWPYAGAPATRLVSYALGHQSLFFAGAWFQVTGTLLSVAFFLAIVDMARATSRLAGLLVIACSTTLLGLVLVEAAFLVAVPIAAANGDSATVVTTFDLSNGVFVRIYPLAPASITYIALGAVILGSGVLHRWFGLTAVSLGVAFEIAGLIAVFSVAGLVLTIVLSTGQALWIIAAAISLLRRPVDTMNP